MRHIIYIIALFLIATPAPADAQVVANGSKEYFNLMGDADKAIKDGKYLDAENYLRQAMRLEPDNPSNALLMSNLGMVQFYDGRADDAILTLSDAHAFAPASVTILLNRARVFTSTGKTEQAMADYTEVIRLDSTLTEPRFYRSMLSLNNGKYQAAKADADTLEAMAPDDRLTHLARATLLIFTASYDKAIPHLTRALDESPDASFYGSRALCYLMTDDPAAASDDIAKGLELDPTDGELYLYRALLNKMRYRPDDAAADGEKAIKFGVDPQRVKMLLNQP